MGKHKLHPDTWIDKYADMLLNYASLRVPELDLARDLVQDTFVTALNSSESYRGEISEKNWLFLVLKSRILDYYKKKKEILASDFENDEEETDSHYTHKGHWTENHSPLDWSTEKMVQTKEFMGIFEQCMSRLKDHHRAVFAMKYLEGKESDDICKDLGISSSNYWVLIHRAKLQLRDCLELNWFKK